MNDICIGNSVEWIVAWISGPRKGFEKYPRARWHARAGFFNSLSGRRGSMRKYTMQDPNVVHVFRKVALQTQKYQNS